MTFSVLYVCEGNVCRSPTAEILFRAAVATHLPVYVTSAGLDALKGDGVYPPCAEVLAEAGLDASSHQARQFQPQMAAQADLVLTASREQRDRLLLVYPRAVNRTFTMREFSRLGELGELGETSPHDCVRRASRRRGLIGYQPEADDDITDPYGRGDHEARNCLRDVAATVRSSLQALGIAHPTGPPGPAARRPVPRRRPSPHRSCR